MNEDLRTLTPEQLLDEYDDACQWVSVPSLSVDSRELSALRAELLRRLAVTDKLERSPNDDDNLRALAHLPTILGALRAVLASLEGDENRAVCRVVLRTAIYLVTGERCPTTRTG